MKKYLLILFLYISFVNAVKAQDITGQIVHADGSPLEFANVVLLQMSDSTFIEGAISKSDGTFLLPQPTTKAFLRVSYLGYTTKNLSLKPDMGRITLEEDTKLLSEVTVKGHRKMFEIGKEGTVTNVIGTPLSKVGTAEDVMGYVPGISKSHDGFTVFGKGTPIIYINDREIHDLSELDRISSEDIKSIELIQTPGVRYDASTRAIVKIRTVRPKGEGLGVRLRSSYWQSQNTDLAEQLDLTYYKKGLYAFGTYKFSKMDNLQKAQIEQVVTTDTLWNQHNLLKSESSQKSHEITTGFNYDVNDKHSLGMKYIVTFSPSYVSNTRTLTSMLADGASFDNLETTSHSVYDNNPSHSLNMFYKGEALGTNIDFNMDYLFSKSGNVENSTEIGESASRVIQSKSYIKNNMLAAKLVLSRQIFKGTLRLGVEALRTTRYDDYTIQGTTIASNSQSKLNETQIAPFAEYEKETPIGRMNVGARYEYVDFEYYKDGTLEKEQSRNFSNLYPYVSLGTKIGNTMLNLSYSVKTKRPTYRQLSSNISYINRFSLQGGNPTLKSEYIHDLSVMGGWKMLQFMISYQDDRNAIINWDESVPGSSAITVLQYKNLNSVKSVSTMLVMAPTVGIWHPQLSLALQKQWLRLETLNGIVSLNKPLLQMGFTNSLTLPYNIAINVDMNYQSKGNYQNAYLNRNIYTLDLSLSKSFFNGALELNIQGSDLFYLRKDDNHLHGNRMEIVQSNRYDSRELGVTLRYNFNVLKKDYKGGGAGNTEKSRM